jgi:general secretion pathway protein D
MALYQQGEAALRAHDAKAALALFRQAYARAAELDPITARQLQDRLQLLSANAGPPRPPAGQPPMVDEVANKQQLLARQLSAEIGHQERTAEKLRETDPKGAIAALEQARAKVESAGLDQASKELLLRRIERQLAQTRKYIQDNQSKISLDEQNRKTKQGIDRDQQNKLDIQTKIAQKVDEFNTLRREQRFPEMQVVAKQALELDPQNMVAQMMVEEAKFILNFANAMGVREQKADGFMKMLHNVETASVPIDDSIPYAHGDAKTWKDLTTKRAKYAKEQGRKLSDKELEIQQKLKTPVSVQFENTPLAKVIDHLGKLAGVNFYLDPQGLAEQGVSTDSPVTIDLRSEIKLESALNLILKPLHLSHVIGDDVLKITSEQYKNIQVYTKTYYVADLVIPIPNFIPNGKMGLAGAYQDAMAAVNFGGAPFGTSSVSPLATVASRDGKRSSAAIDPTVLAQMSNGSRNATPASTPTGGPAGMGGAAMADFDSLISLITSTIQPTTWDEVGGPGSIAPFETNLSLVVSQTQEVHEEVADLLDQLRRIQDLQVTIEVRFITLNDNFFERIGVDFDFKVNDKTDQPGMNFGRMVGVGDPPSVNPVRDTRKTIFDEFGHEHSRTVGMSAPGAFATDLDIPFTQNSFGLAVPQFGGFTPEAGMQMGFAILSEIEAFFFINAAQGDRRSNVLQAPKVTLFNGQMAFVADTSNSPFVISVVPVVGDFAAAQQPVIVVLSEGTFLTVQAVVSSDRRFVRLTVVPYFSTIGKVDTFTFTGSETSTTTSSQEGQQDQPNDNTKKANNTTTSRQGTTVQLPTFAFVTVTTTVSVPDGGTVLLGGIKRLSEGRNEFGVPILNKIPYLNRLFKNVGIGRETQSLMMMVTPRIIIQEEEEERLGIQQPAP